MAGEDRVLMSAKEIKRLHVVEKYHEGLIGQIERAEILGVSCTAFQEAAEESTCRRSNRSNQ
jgi:predicted HTH domain antitoxin